MPEQDLHSTSFAVNEEPYVVWGYDLELRNKQFIDGLDPSWFSYLLDVHLGADDEKHAGVALRIALHHGIEAMFLLLGAFVQAPQCAYAWIDRCRNEELREFVRRVGAHDRAMPLGLRLETLSWESVARAMFHSFQPDTERQAATVAGFSGFWDAMARELTDERYLEEYNAMKHGFRLRSTGFTLAVGREEQPGIPASPSAMQVLGGSEHGSSFLKMSRVAKDRGPHLVSRRIGVNWSIERIVLQFQLVQMSISNTVSALKFIGGTPASECLFVRPESDEDFSRPWHYSPGVTGINIDFVIEETRLPTITKAELLKRLRAR